MLGVAAIAGPYVTRNGSKEGFEPAKDTHCEGYCQLLITNDYEDSKP